MLVCLMTGCGGNDKLASVTGTITLDAKPLPNAFVQFIPTSGGTTSYGKTDSRGNYEMVFTEREKGAFIGENRVEINTGDVAAPGEKGIPEVVPTVYNRQTTLKADVQPGSNKFDFDLKSDAGKVIQVRPE